MRRQQQPNVFATIMCFAACIMLGVLGAKAQVSRGSISGTVLDASGAAVPKSEVRAVSVSSGQSYQAKTNTAGNFRLTLLAVGQYKLIVTKQGFQQLAVPSVRVTPAADTGLGKLTLSVGEVTTTIQVSGAPPLLQTTQSQVSTTITSSTIQHFPGVNENEGMDFVALMLPGVVNPRDAMFSNSNGVGVSNNGLSARYNDQEIDGQFNNDNSVTGPAMFLSNPDFVQQYQVITDNFGPEYGRNSGSVINIITKTGTNQYHGDAYITESNSGLDTLSNTQKAFEGLHKVPYFNDEFSGASFGGPIRRDKAFFFGGFDNEIVPSSGVFSAGGLTPTPAGLTALGACPFANAASLAVLTKYGPYGITGGNPVISGTPSVQTLTDPLNASVTCNIQMAGVQRTLSTMSREYDALVKIDGGGTRDHVSGRWIYQKLGPINTNAYGSSAAGYPINVPSFGEDFGLSWVHTLTTDQVNEARISFGRLVVQFGGNGIGNTIPNQGELSSALANVSFSAPTLLSFGVPVGAPNGRVNNVIQVQDNWTYIRGKHQFKAGWNWTNQRSPNIFLPFYDGGFTYPDFSSYVANIPSVINVALGNPQLPFHENDHYLYAGDDYKVKPDLTLNLGLTFAYFGQPANLFHQITVKNETSSQPFFDPALPLSVRTTPELPSIKDNFGPSVGFAWSPSWLGAGKTVIRGGYRLINDPTYYNIYLNVANGAPVVLLQTLTGTTAAANPLLSAPFGPAVRAQLASSLTLGVSDPRSFNQIRVANNLRPDRVSEWSFGVQRAFGPSMVLEARYVGNHGTDLLQSINANPDIAGLGAAFPSLVPAGLTPCPAAQAAVPTSVGRVNCNEGIVDQVGNTGYSYYNALQLNLRANNWKHQLTLLISYTWSKATDNTTDVYGTFVGGNTFSFSQDPLSYTGAEYGLSGFDIPQNFTVSFYEALPFFRNRGGFRGRLLGGWGLSGTYDLASGQPFTPVQFSLNTLTGGTVFDSGFDSAFNSSAETARPFMSNPAAPQNRVGMFAADACAYFAAGCSLPANTLLDFNALNASSGATVTAISESSVRYIVNGVEADSLFKTPFGTAGRNVGRDWWTNTGSFAIYKNIKVTERASVRFWATAINVFNTPNYASVDPFVDDAGLARQATGFADPELTGGGNRVVKFGLKVFF